MQFLVVEFTGGELPFLNFTRHNPNGTADLIMEALDPKRSGPRTGQETLFLLQGAPMETMDAFVNRLAAIHGAVQPLRRDRERGLWLGRISFKPGAIPDATAHVLRHVLLGLGSVWVHCEAGVLHLRARVPVPEPAGLVEGVEAALAFAGVEAQVEIRESGTHDYSVWQELVEHSVGLSP